MQCFIDKIVKPLSVLVWRNTRNCLVIMLQRLQKMFSLFFKTISCKNINYSNIIYLWSIYATQTSISLFIKLFVLIIILVSISSSVVLIRFLRASSRKWALITFRKLTQTIMIWWAFLLFMLISFMDSHQQTVINYFTFWKKSSIFIYNLHQHLFMVSSDLNFCIFLKKIKIFQRNCIIYRLSFDNLRFSALCRSF